eukprot:TRINITY_DN169_c0_g1_i2.p1 TRINITY_DN169_c0_g1~~TRINITY_DN169_c0_g1_i2.p1  ORF type:complete len:704 (-),score=145.92 TRINITY_DN169_c0_g1_i2:42-2153(-)
MRTKPAMKTILILTVLLSITLSNAQTLFLNTDGDLFDSLGSSYTGSVNIGSSGGSLFTVSNASVMITGAVSMGGFNSPVLEIEEGLTFNVSSFTLTRGSVQGKGLLIARDSMSVTSSAANVHTGRFLVQGGLTVSDNGGFTVGANGSLLVMGNTQVSTFITIEEGADVMFQGDISGSSYMNVYGNVMLSPDVSLTIGCSVSIYPGSSFTLMNDVTISRDIVLSGTLEVPALFELTLSGSVTDYGVINATGTLTFNPSGTEIIYPTVHINGGGSATRNTFQGVVNINSDFDVSEGAAFRGQVNIAETHTLSCSSSSSFSADASFYHDVRGNGEIMVGGTVNVNSGITIEPMITLLQGGDLTLSSGTTINHITLNGDLDISSEVYIGSTQGAGLIQVTSTLNINGSQPLTFGAPLLVDRFSARVYVLQDTDFTGTINLPSGRFVVEEGATATLSGDTTLSGGYIDVYGKASLGGNFTIGGFGQSYISVYGSLDINTPIDGNVRISFSSSDPTVTSTINTEFLDVSLQFNQNSSVVSAANTNYSSITLYDSSTFTVQGRSYVSDSITLVSGSTLAFSSTGSLYTYGSITLGEDSIYKVSGVTESSQNYARVVGYATLGGHLVVETSQEFTRDTKLTIMTYGRRIFSSTFASITINGNKRDLHQDNEYEVVYADKEAYVRLTYTGLESSSIQYVFSIIMIIAALILN